MTNKQALDWAQRLLEDSGDATARLDALVLLEDCTKIDRAHLLAEPAAGIDKYVINKFKRQVKKRSLHYPLAYIRGKTEFYGRQFLINRFVLEPRPESEVMIDEFKTVIEETPHASVVDIGTGSGALAITAKLERPKIQAYATDISAACLKISLANSKMLGAKVAFFKTDLILNLPTSLWQTPSLVLANLPYVPDNWQINPAAMREPKIAIFGGTDGLDTYRKFFAQISALKLRPGFILTESLPPQHEALAKIASYAGYNLRRTNDFIQLYRLADMPESDT